jgi:putative chitinase
MLTLANVQAGCGATSANAAKWLSYIQAACDAYQINTPLRLAAFLATIGVESEYLTTAQENLDYSAQGLADTWPRLFANNGVPNALATSLARNPQGIANAAYAYENGNGGPTTGDGWRYRGQGLIQITGASNYSLATIGANLDLVNHPELLQLPQNAALVSAWFWSNGNLNALADAGEITAISKYINCGNPNSSATPNGMPERLTLYNAACASLGC